MHSEPGEKTIIQIHRADLCKGKTASAGVVEPKFKDGCSGNSCMCSGCGEK